MADGQKNITEKIIDLYTMGEVSVQAQEEFLDWLVSDIHSEEKDQALKAVWDNIDIKAKSSTYSSFNKVRGKVSLSNANKKRRIPFGRAVARVAAVLIPLVAVAGAYLMLNKQQPAAEGAPEMMAMRTVSVPAGETQQVELPDGSRVWVRGGSEITYPEQFENERNVTLAGEAFFDVEKGEIPFLVNTEHVAVKVLGTEFNVSAFTDEPIHVTLESGSIEAMLSCGETLLMKEGEQLHYDHLTETVSLVTPKVSASEWRHGILTIHDMMLGDIFRSLEAHYGVEINTDSPINSTEHYFTRFTHGDSLDDALMILSELTGEFSYVLENGKKVMIYLK